MSNSSLEKVLIIDDNSDYRKLIKTFISKLLPNVEVIEYDPVFEGAPGEEFDWSQFDVLLLDYHLSIVGTTGLDILHKHHKKPTFPATIMLTGAGTEEIAIRALKSGIYEYQPKQSLTKDKLKQSIIHAWEDKIADRRKQQEITQHNRSFSKEVFYENLGNAFDDKDTKRVLVVIKPDNLKELEQQIGIVGRDNLVNFIGKNSFEVFKLGACNPNITKISDDAIAIQIDYPINIETLDFNMQGLCKHLSKCIFKFSDEKFHYSVSIGVLDLSLFKKPAEELIAIGLAASDKTSSDKNNSYYIWQAQDTLTKTTSDDKKQDTIQKEDSSKLEEQLKTEAAAREKAEAEAREKAEAAIQAEQAAKKKLEEELKTVAEAKEKAEAEAREKAEAAIQAEQAAKRKLEEQLKAEAAAREKAEAEAREKAEAAIQAEQAAKKKLEEELKSVAEAKEKAESEAREKAEAAIQAEQAAKKKLEEELKANAEIEARAKIEAEIRAEQDAKEKAEAKLKAEAEAKAKTEAEIRVEQEAKQRIEAELKAQAEADAKTQAEAELKAIKEAKEKLEAELKAVAEARAKAEAEAKSQAEAEIQAAKEAKEKLEAELKAAAEAKAKAEAEAKSQAEAEIQAAKEEKEKLEAELKAAAEAKAKAEAEIQAAKEEKEKLEAELKAAAEAKAKAEVEKENIATQKVASQTEHSDSEDQKEAVETTKAEEDTSNKSDDVAIENNTEPESAETDTDNSVSIAATEDLIRKLIDDKRILQTYQPVVAMFDDGNSDNKEIYKTGLLAIGEDDELNNKLADISIFSDSLQLFINEWSLRQVFLRITESGTSDSKYRFILSATETWFTEITLFNWLQKILAQTKKYSPGKSIILNVPIEVFLKHEKRATALLNTLHKTHYFSIALSNIDAVDKISEFCSSTSSKLLMLDIETLKKLSEVLSPQQEKANEKTDEETDAEVEKKNLLQHLKQGHIKIMTSGIEDATLLTDAITAGTDYVIGSFVGETQDNLIDNGTVESFELT